MKHLFIASLFALCGFAAASSTACSSVEHTYDCAGICQKYADCVDSDFDVSGCTDSCADKADQDEDFADRADDCQACVDDRACSETFPCLDECVGVVP